MPEDVKWYVLWFYLDSWMGEPAVLGSNIGCEVKWSQVILRSKCPWSTPRYKVKWPTWSWCPNYRSFLIAWCTLLFLTYFFIKTKKIISWNLSSGTKVWNFPVCECKHLWWLCFWNLPYCCSVSLLLATVNCLYSQYTMTDKDVNWTVIYMLYCIEEEDALLRGKQMWRQKQFKVQKSKVNILETMVWQYSNAVQQKFL